MTAPYGALRWLANAAFAAALLFSPALAHAKPIRILVLGDSLAAGFGLAQPDAFQAQMQAALRAHGYDVSLVDAAVSGDTTAGGLARLDWALGDGADAAMVELGGNDGLRGLNPADMEANLAAILDRLAARHIPVLLCGMYAPPNFGPQYGDEFKAVFNRLGQRQGVVFDPFILEGVAADPALNQADHLHPSAAGVKIEVAHLLPYMERLIAMVPQ